MTVKSAAILLLGALLTVNTLSAQPDYRIQTDTIPEHHETRRVLESLLTGPISTVLVAEPTVFRQSTSGHRVRFEVQRSGDAVYLLFLNEQRGSFPIAGRGNWVVRRRASGGAIDQVKLFLTDDPEFYARIQPGGGRSLMEVVLAGDTIYRDVPVPIAFEQLLLRPFADIRRATRSIVDWELFQRPAALGEYATVERMVDLLRPALATLPDAEDGAMDRHGNLVFIESLVMQDQLPGFNCSGFAKWVVDGLYYPRTGTYLDIDSLKQRHLDVRGHGWSRRLEEQRDPYFGLDWSRNLALAITQLDYPGYHFEPTTADVGSLPFARSVPNIGFEIDELNRVLYLLARNEPGHFYIGSVNREFGSAPVLRQHVHLVVIFPYFDSQGRYRAVVMERNVESSVASLQRRYRGDAVHLVRIRAGDEFVPPLIGGISVVE